MTRSNWTERADRVFNVVQKDLLSISLDGTQTFDRQEAHVKD